ncbi:MAG: L,D-transpeptidase family protein [Candidatus Moranbacteria bacterium]|nr:L,D-transpeptidase family protein [Candidatus Moranbacteria bacterium]
MSLRALKAISFVLSVSIGLVAAFISVDRVESLFPSVSATTISDSVKTPYDPFLVRFSEAVRDSQAIGRISVLPDQPFRTEWRDGGKTLAVMPEGRWDAGSLYRLTLSGGKDGFLKTVPSSSFQISIPDYPGIVNFDPENGSKEVMLDIEDPVTVVFDRSASDFYLDFRLSPAISVAYENDGAKTKFGILPKEAAKPGTEYTLSVYAKWRGEQDGAFRFLGETRFITAPEKPTEWAKDLDERVDQAKRYARPLRTVGKYIDVNLESQIMTIFENGEVLDAYVVSSGKKGMETPKGEYATRNKTPRAWSSAYGLYMPYWMALVSDGKIGIHELPEWPGGYKEGANHLGVPVSHGCIRLGVGPARRVYEWAELGTVVIVR